MIFDAVAVRVPAGRLELELEGRKNRPDSVLKMGNEA